MQGGTSSSRNEARSFKVDRKWCDRLVIAAAQLGRSRHTLAFGGLLERAAHQGRPVAVFLLRAYDETGRVCRTQSMTPEGELLTSTETGKLMSGRVSFAVVLEHAGRWHVIQGVLPTLMVVMANQTAPVVPKCLSRFFNAAEHVAGISSFPLVTRLRCADLHRS